MEKVQLRTFREFDLDEVTKHLLIFGDLKGDCGSCRAIGLDQFSVGVCPECGTPYKYATSRRMEMNPGERFQLVKRIAEKRPDLTVIDYSDYKTTLGKKKAREFFK